MTTALLWAVLTSSMLCANGVYVPERWDIAMPQIPLQRGLITYRNGVETLVLESSLKTQSKSVGWIVPLPSEPTKVELGGPDMLRILAASQQPDVIHDLSMPLAISFVAVIWMVPVAVWMVLKRRRERWPAVVVMLAWLVDFLLLLFALYLLIPAAGSAEVSDDVTVSAVHRLGSYEASVLRANTPEALDEWLEREGLAKLDAAAKEVVAKYIAQKWCFVVSRLATDATEVAVPRPLVMSFPTPTCVFPMRLTQLAGGTTRVELYVAADQEAQAKGFRCVLADEYRRDPSEENTVCVAKHSGVRMTSVDVHEMLWDGCVLTYLTADLTPAQMADDVSISFRALEPSQQRAYSNRAKLELSGVVGCWSVVVLSIVGASTCAGRRAPSPAGRAGMIAVLAAGTVVIGGLAWALPTVSAFPKINGHTGVRYSKEEWPLVLLAMSAASDGKLNDETKLEDVLPTLAAMPRGHVGIYINGVTGERIGFERTPGNLNMRTVNGRKYLCLYGGSGAEYRIRLRPAKDGAHPTTSASNLPVETQPPPTTKHGIR